VGAAPQAAALSARELAPRIEAYLDPYLQDGHLSGTLLIARKGEVLLERSYGMADYETGVPNTPQTRFCVASINTPMTIAPVCQLVDEKKLSPDQTVDQWIPGFPCGDQITISHLLNHRAGIPHRVTRACDEIRPTTAAEMVEYVKKAQLMFAPGEKSVYSSAGYSVLARIIELATGQTYGQAIDERLFRRAAMTHSVHPDGWTLIHDRAASYLPGLGAIRKAPLKDYSFLVGAGAVFSTPDDLHKLIQALLASALGETAKTALLRDNGLRWNGNTNGYIAFADYYADTAVEVIFTSNLHTGAIDRMRDALPKIINGEDVPATRRLNVKAVAVADSVLRRYEGKYRADSGQEFTLRVKRGTAFAGERALVPTSATTFFSPQGYGDVSIVRGADGAIARLDWTWTGGVLVWKRVGDVVAGDEDE
jgi:CubicO group peptidase (beta-lactamase class C family)